MTLFYFASEHGYSPNKSFIPLPSCCSVPKCFVRQILKSYKIILDKIVSGVLLGDSPILLVVYCKVSSLPFVTNTAE